METDFCLRDQSSRKASPRQACGGKTSNHCVKPSVYLPERHAGFARASLSRRSLQAKSDRPGKNGLSALCLRGSAVNI